MPEEHEFDHLIGELAPGDKGWLPLDEAGTPISAATLLPPPGPDAKAASVSVSYDGHLVSSSGAPLEPPLNSNIDKRVGEAPPVTPVLPTLTSISPTTAVVGTSIPISLTGTGFTDAAVIVFGGVDQTTAWVSDTSLTATIDGTAAVAGTVQVSVRDSAGSTAELPFEYTAAGRSSRR
jgi:hypothetical protein